MTPRKKKSSEVSEAWHWEEILDVDTVSSAASVLLFPHVPLFSSWSGISVVGTVGEVESSSFTNRVAIRKAWREKKHFWHVEVVKYAGYFCQIRFLGYPSSQAELIEANKYWVHVLDVKEIGHFRSANISNSPPFVMNATEDEVKDQLYKSIYNHYSVCRIDMELSRSNEDYVRKWPLGSHVETINKECCRQMRPGVVKKETGLRLLVQYYGYRKDNSNGCWVHDSSDLIKPQGWCKSVGAEISDPEYYHPGKLPLAKVYVTDHGIIIEEGMLFEMVNPIRRNEIAVGRVTKVLEQGFFLCCIESKVFPADLEKHCKGVNEFHFHISSDLIFPCGTCAKFGQLMCKPGNDEKMVAQFDWNNYFRETGKQALPFPEKRRVHNGNYEFKRGMWLEAVDFHESQLVCPAIIVAIMSPYVMKIRFDGWEDKYDQWKSIDSKELFPMGWCQLVNHPLAQPGPVVYDRISQSRNSSVPRCGTPAGKKDARTQRRSKRKVSSTSDNSSRCTSVNSQSEDIESVSSCSSGVSIRKKLGRNN